MIDYQCVSNYFLLQCFKRSLDGRMRYLLEHCEIVFGSNYLEVYSPNKVVTKHLSKRALYLSRKTRSKLRLGLIIRSSQLDLIVN